MPVGGIVELKAHPARRGLLAGDFHITLGLMIGSRTHRFALLALLGFLLSVGESLWASSCGSDMTATAAGMQMDMGGPHDEMGMQREDSRSEASRDHGGATPSRNDCPLIQAFGSCVAASLPVTPATLTAPVTAAVTTKRFEPLGQSFLSPHELFRPPRA
jgi:hypothetical protein